MDRELLFFRLADLIPDFGIELFEQTFRAVV